MGLFKTTYYSAPYDLLSDGESVQESNEPTAEEIEAILFSCDIPCSPGCRVISASSVTYHFNLFNLKDISKLPKAIQALSARLRLNAMQEKSPYGDFAVSITRKQRQVVTLKNAMLGRGAGNDSEYSDFTLIDSPVKAALGKDSSNNPVIIDLAKLPHLLIAGATGSGKTVALHSIITSMIRGSTPHQLEFIMIDPKQIELGVYSKIPHLVRPIVNDIPSAINTLQDVCDIMDRRYREIKRGKTGHTRLIVVIDELADLMLTSKKAVETSIVRIAQLGRAAGIHLLVATQKPTVNVVTGLIKANIPARLALTMASYRDSGVVEVKGADKLGGQGDALYQDADHTKPPVRLQVAWCSPNDSKAIADYWRSKECRKPRPGVNYKHKELGTIRT